MLDTRSLQNGFQNREEFEWTFGGVEGQFSALQILENVKYLHSLKWFLLSIFILIQSYVVLLNTLLLLLFAILMTWFFMLIKKFVNEQKSIDDDKEIRILNTNSIQLEGEVEIPKSVIRNVRRLADQLIQKGRRMQPKNLLNLLRRSTTFNGVRRFDSNQISCLLSDQEPSNCWILPIAILTNIVVATPKIDRRRTNLLLHSVREGFSLAKSVEKTLVKDTEIDNSRIKTPDLCLSEVDIYRRWLSINLRDDYIKLRPVGENVVQQSSRNYSGVQE